MFWFFSPALASVLNTERLKAVCSVGTVRVFKQGSLCLFKRMGKWLSRQIRLKKQEQDSHSLAQMSAFATWLAFGGILKQNLLARWRLCSLWHLTEERAGEPQPMAHRPWRTSVPRLDISQSLLNYVIIKLMEHKRNFSNCPKDPIQM